MQRIYIDTSKEAVSGGLRSALFFLFVAIIVITVSFFLVGTYKEARNDLIEALQQEKKLVEANNMLKLELSGITRTRLLELKAKERLGLEKPKEEEVLVLK